MQIKNQHKDIDQSLVQQMILHIIKLICLWVTRADFCTSPAYAIYWLISEFTLDDYFLRDFTIPLCLNKHVHEWDGHEIIKFTSAIICLLAIAHFFMIEFSVTVGNCGGENFLKWGGITTLIDLISLPEWGKRYKPIKV